MDIPLLTDSHCHLGSHKFSPDELPAIVETAREAGVHRLITLATNLKDIPVNLGIAQQFDNVFACVGIHPCDAHETPNDYLDSLQEFASHPRVAAIGETGLDYYHPAPEGWSEDDYHRHQRSLLQQHFELASRLGLNVVIHTRDRRGDASFSDALEIYEAFASQVRAVFHCFPGPAHQVKRVLRLGGLVSFTGIATFKNASDVLAAACETPAGRLMVETDSPYLAPVPHRGKRCEPAHASHTARCLAEARSEPLNEFAAHTEETVNTFFRLKG